MESTIDPDGFSSTRKYAFFTGKNGKQVAEQYANNKNATNQVKEYQRLMGDWIANNPAENNNIQGWIDAVKQQSMFLRNALNINNEDMHYYYVTEQS